MIGKGRDLLRRTRRRNHPVRLLASDADMNGYLVFVFGLLLALTIGGVCSLLLYME